MSEERSASSPDSSEVIEVTAEEPLDPKAARRARRAKAKLALRIPDDEVSRPQTAAPPPPPKPNGDADSTQKLPAIEPSSQTRAATVEAAPESAAIQPSRIISVGPPPPDAATQKNIDTDDDDTKTPIMPPVSTHTAAIEAKRNAPTVVDGEEADAFDVPVDEDVPEYRPRTPTLPSNPPPAPISVVPPSEDALEIDDVEAAAVLSSRPPPPLAFTTPSVPAPPRLPAISSKPPAPPPISVPTSAIAAPPPPPITPPVPADAMTSGPQLPFANTNEFIGVGHMPPSARQRGVATALVDEEEARGIEEIEPDRQSAPPSVDSGDEIATSDLVAVPPALAKPARPISTPPPKAPPATSKPPVPKEATVAAMIPIVGLTPALPSPLAPPPLSDLVPRRRARPWWEDLFNDDFVRTTPKFTDAQIGAEVDFIEDSLGVARGGNLLDLGCGTGRHAIDLSRRGYTVVGFDLSLAMLARAGEEAQERSQKINFVQGDMREMTFDEAFDGIYCWGSTFGYFEEDKNAQVLGKVHKALRHGGQFLLDVVGRDFIIKQSPSLAWFEGEGCVCMDEMNVDWITSRMRIKRTMMLDDGRSKEIEYSMRIYSLHELGKLLHDCGFRIAEVSGRIHTPGVFFGPDSPRTLILAEKK